ncbi:MAG: RDD family protein [Anaeroplasma sp.]|nr:RDD family protein [Anaeroplasma sp.]
MREATTGERLLVYLIDIVVMGWILSFFTNLIFKGINYDSDYLSLVVEQITGYLEEYLNSIVNNTSFDMNKLYIALGSYFEIVAIRTLITISFDLVFVVLYLVILPKFWKNQTLGRFFVKVKVVNKNGEDLTTKNIIFRELIGTFLLYMVLGSFGVLLASVILIINSKRSLVDYVGKTKLVKINEDNTTTKTIIDDNDYDDLSYVYIKREEIDSKDDNSSNNYNDQSDDDYKVF